jgi:NADPH:quinone reductase-like Zn-dependent oxidoreductase
LVAKHAKLEVKSAPYTSPREDEIVIKNRAVAINPIDWMKQYAGDLMFSWIRYPFVLSSDLAGEVVEVGKSVSRFKVWDRVLGHGVAMNRERNNPAEGAFQAYTIVLAHMAAPIPSAMSYESATVLPLCMSTAACGLFQKDHLALQYPSVPAKPTGKTILVWGGSTSVGSNAIQLAVATGYEVITTSSPRNFDYVKKPGASQAFDYNSKSVVEDVIEALKGKTITGALAVGNGSGEACMDIVQICNGDKFVSMASFPISSERLLKRPGMRFQLLQLFIQIWLFNVSMWFKSRRRHIRTNFIFGSSLKDNQVSRVIYEDFRPRALGAGRYVAAPDPYFVIRDSITYKPGSTFKGRACPRRKCSSHSNLAPPRGRAARPNREQHAGTSQNNLTPRPDARRRDGRPRARQ